ncbi:MAG: response regulator transcription factor [Gemmatimonadales bacterium]
MARHQPTVLIADDHVVFAEGLAESLKPHFAIVGLVTRLERFVSTVVETAPDVIVLDLTFQGESSLGALRELRDDHPPLPATVILTAHTSHAMERAALDAGALAFLSKDASTQELCLAITAALEGRPYVRHADMRSLSRRRGPRLKERDVIAGALLTRQQAHFLILLAAGLSRQEIAVKLDIGVKTGDYHLQQAKQMVGVANLRLLHVWATEHLDELLAFAGEPPD